MELSLQLSCCDNTWTMACGEWYKDCPSFTVVPLLKNILAVLVHPLINIDISDIALLFHLALFYCKV